jgi:DNA modification methylase
VEVRRQQYRDVCGKCGARRIDQQIGLEATPEEHVAVLVDVFREVWRVMRPDATLWLNYGDLYAGSWGNQGRKEERGTQRPINGPMLQNLAAGYPANGSNTGKCPPGLKPKDLVGMPWRVAFALQAAGWWLRSAITICKNNPMPESVQDRPTQATEMLFLLTKAERYYYDADAIREPLTEPLHAPGNRVSPAMTAGPMSRNGHSQWDRNMKQPWGNPAGRNRRNWWVINTQALKEAHFAAFSEKLVEPCILAGTSERGCCPACGAPWVRETSKELEATRGKINAEAKRDGGELVNGSAGYSGGVYGRYNVQTTGWRPTCTHNLEPEPCVCLDPFAGSGTTLRVATRLGRKSSGIELNETYVKDILRKRTAQGGLGL